MPRDRYDLALWGVVLLALAARFWDLGGPSVWLDETASVREMSPIGSRRMVIMSEQLRNQPGGRALMLRQFPRDGLESASSA